LISVQRPRDLEARIGKLEEKVRAAHRRPVSAADTEPITVKEHAAWEEAQQRLRKWRTRVDAVLTYCESGKLPAVSELEGAEGRRLDAAPSAAQLAQRAGALASAVELPGRSPAAPETKRLADLLNAVFEDQHWEPAAQEKDVILSRLSLLVRPDPGRWVTMHEVIREASAVAKKWPALAAWLGVEGASAAAAPAERAPRALVFLELAAAVPQVVGKWRHATTRAAPGGSAEALLATPGHPAIAQAHQECLALAGRLGREGEVPKAPPLSPAAPTVAAFRSWWRQIEELLVELAELRLGIKDLEGRVLFARDGLVQRARELCERATEIPADRRSPDLAELESATREVAESNGVVTQRAYSHFTAVLARVEAWYDKR